MRQRQREWDRERERERMWKRGGRSHITIIIIDMGMMLLLRKVESLVESLSGLEANNPT